MLRVFACLVISVVSAGTSAAITINLGDYTLLPNEPGQEIEIFVTGDEQVQGLNFNAQIVGDTPAPAFQNVDLVTDTIFAPNHNPPIQIAGLPQIQVWSLTTSSGSILADGLLATLTVDTTGIFGGTWDLNLEDTANGSTDFANDLLPVEITDGTLSIVPEPSSVGIFAVLLCAIAVPCAAARLGCRAT